MCGRYTLNRSAKELLERFAVQQVLFPVAARYNIAPSQEVAVVLNDKDTRCLEQLKWGLIPFWVKDLKKTKPLINARAESLAEKPSFKQALARRRCLIPADGFYEWKSEAATRTPMYIQMRDHRLFAFAGLWEEWKAPDGTPLRTCAIITVPANRIMSDIHERMPAILQAGEEALWLDPTVKDPPRLLSLLKPYGDEDMEAYSVTRRV